MAHPVTCRICLETEDKMNMIVPCGCIGSIKYVHRECLDEWRSSGINPKNLTQCPVCHSVYETEYRGIGRYSSLSVALAWVAFDLIWKMLLATFVCGYFFKGVMCLIVKEETYCFAHYYWPDSSHAFTWVIDHMTHGFVVFLAFAGLYAIGKGIYLWWTGGNRRQRGRRLGNDGQPLDPQNNHNNGLDDHNDHNDDDFEHRGGHNPLNNNPYRRSYFYWNDPFLWFPRFYGRGGGGGGGGGSSSSSRSDGDCKKDCGKFLLVVIVVVGIAFLLYFIAKCIYKTIQDENEKMRKTLAKQYYVIDKRSKPEYRAQREAKKKRAATPQQTSIAL